MAFVKLFSVLNIFLSNVSWYECFCPFFQFAITEGTKIAKDFLVQALSPGQEDLEDKKADFQLTVQELFHKISANKIHSAMVQEILESSKKIQTMTTQVDLDKDAEQLR